MKEKLRIGIILNNNNIPKWSYSVIENLINTEFADIKVVVDYRDVYNRAHGIAYSAFYKFHEKIDSLITYKRTSYNKLLNSCDILKGVPRLSIPHSFEFSEGKIDNFKFRENIKHFNLDLVLDFGNIPWNANYSEIATYGIWSYNLGDSSRISGFSNGYWEMVKKFPEIGATIKVVKYHNEKEVVIYKTWVSTNYNSINLNRNHVYNLASFLIPRIIKKLYLFGNVYFDYLIKRNQVNNTSTKVRFASPSSLISLLNLINMTGRYIHKKIFYLTSDYWFILFKYSNIPPLSDTFDGFRSIKSPRDRFWADPFVVTRDHKHYIFVEELFYKHKKGHISVLVIDHHGKLLQVKKILERPYHLSYPFVFESDNTHFMIPETGSNNTIELYKCIQFPDKWEFVTCLMEKIQAKDTTLFFYNNKWWIFTSINESIHVPNYYELFLYYSDDLLSSNWSSHPRNPIVSDFKTARPAGRIFTHENKIYRPSQDCLGRYGKAINLNQITALSETEYEEILVQKVEPHSSAKIKGTHTLNFSNEIIVLDAYEYRKRWMF